MKIYITQSGKVIVISILLVGAIFFMLGGASIISKLVENHRVHSYQKINISFNNTDITYKDYDTLKNAFTVHYKKISKDLDDLKKLNDKYPNNSELKEKIENYQLYFNSMEKAEFICPEHINSSLEERSKECICCGGDGTHFLFWMCSDCRGTGKINYNVNIVQKCPHCGQIHKSFISGKSLLK